MTQGAQDAGGGFGQSAGGNAARGILVMVAAVLVGIVLLRTGLGGSDTASADDQEVVTETTDQTTETVATDSDGSTTTVTATPDTLGVGRPSSEVAVLVLNGTDGPAQGIAGKGTEKLKTNAYITRSPSNATAPGPSVIYYSEGFESEAIAVAEVLGADPTSVVKALDAGVPVEDIQAADIVVVVGNDGVIVV